MPLIKADTEIENDWIHVPGEDEVLPDGRVTVTLSRFLAQPAAKGARSGALGVRLAPDDDPMALNGHFDAIELIEVDFPKYTDGRGYSIAQLLRRRLGYRGELRAVGHVLRDQILYMQRSGFDAFLTQRASLESAMEAGAEFSVNYQPAADGAKSIFSARHAGSPKSKVNANVARQYAAAKHTVAVCAS